MAGTFWGEKSLKILPNKVFRFFQPALINGSFPVVILKVIPPYFCDLSTFSRISTKLLFFIWGVLLANIK